MQSSVQQDEPIVVSQGVVSAAPERMLPQVYTPPKRAPKGFFWVTIVCTFVLACVLLGGAWADTNAPTSIVLTPTTHSVQVPFSQTVPTHLVHAASLAQQETIATTGVVQQEASAAHGIITLYNASDSAITLAAGTTLPTPNGGVSLVFDTKVTIPKVNYTQAKTGIATVAAHSDPVGSQGNLAIGILKDVPCCGHEGAVYASLLFPFTGGRDVDTYHTVTKTDVAQARDMLESGLTTSATAALHTQLVAGEQFIQNRVECHSTVQTDHAIGSKADQVTVVVQVSCQGNAYTYTPQQAQNDADQMAQVHPAFAAPFTLTSLRVVQVQEKGFSLNTVSLVLTVQEVWIYPWSRQQIHALASRLAGLTDDQAQNILRHLEGVGTFSVSLSPWGGTTLSSDPQQIVITISLPKQ